MSTDYRELLERHYHQLKGVSGAIDVAEMLANPPRAPQHGDTWGRWKLNTDNWSLELFEDGQWLYYLDLEEATNPAKLLHFIFQVAGKGWTTPEDIGHLVHAVDDLVLGAGQPLPFGRPPP